MSEVLQRIDGIEGVVKWFDQRKGFGFIVGPEGQDVFTHYSVIEGDGFRILEDGSTVKYDAVLTAKGWKATRVVRPPAPPGAVPPGRPHGERGEVVVPRRGYSRTPRR